VLAELDDGNDVPFKGGAVGGRRGGCLNGLELDHQSEQRTWRTEILRPSLAYLEVEICSAGSADIKSRSE